VEKNKAREKLLRGKAIRGPPQIWGGYRYNYYFSEKEREKATGRRKKGVEGPSRGEKHQGTTTGVPSFSITIKKERKILQEEEEMAGMEYQTWCEPPGGGTAIF